jgi:hypothetical protein
MLTRSFSFVSYRTGEYKLHYYETPTRIKFVMITDTKTNNLRVVLHQIWANLYVEYVVKNPLSPVEHPGGVGVANELFEAGLEGFMVCWTPWKSSTAVPLTTPSRHRRPSSRPERGPNCPFISSEKDRRGTEFKPCMPRPNRAY